MPHVPPPSRAAQLDSERLDSSMESLLLHDLHKVLRFLPSSPLSSPSPTTRILLHLLLHLPTTVLHRPTPGKSLYNLRFRASSAPPLRFGDDRAPLSFVQRLLLPALGVAPHVHALALAHLLHEPGDPASPAAWHRDRLPTSPRRRLARLLASVETLARVGGVVNFLAFLATGRYPSLSHRLSRARLCYADVAAPAGVAFEFVNTHLVWAGFADALVFLTPIVWSPRVRRGVAAIVAAAIGSGGGGGGGARVVEVEGEGEGREGRCGVCGAGRPVMPFVALPCRHVYCYACLAVGMEKEARFSCGRCGVAVHAKARVTSSGVL